MTHTLCSGEDGREQGVRWCPTTGGSCDRAPVGAQSGGGGVGSPAQIWTARSGGGGARGRGAEGGRTAPVRSKGAGGRKGNAGEEQGRGLLPGAAAEGLTWGRVGHRAAGGNQ
jgi:hypothetical protein